MDTDEMKPTNAASPVGDGDVTPRDQATDGSQPSNLSHSSPAAHPCSGSNDIAGAGDEDKTEINTTPAQSASDAHSSSVEAEASNETGSRLAEVDRVIKMAEEQQEMTGGNDPEKSIYFLKRISFHDQTIPIVTQNLNGPCPLLAITNVLLLTQRIKLDVNSETINNRRLMSLLGELVLTSQPKNLAQGEQANYEQIVSDAINVFHKLQTGLDVNVRFSGVDDFEFTSELSVFDLLRVGLYHGWLADPDSEELSSIADLTYNQLVTSLFEWKEKDIPKAMVAEEFLNCSQLTYYGLSQLYSTLSNKQLAVLFRNNHFSTVYRHNDKLYLLVTDQGYLRESRVVWETLENIEGDGILVDSEFRPLSANPASPPLVQIGSAGQVEQDMMLAMNLQQEQIIEQSEITEFNVRPTTAHAQETDEQFAKRLQMEERAALEQVGITSPTQPPANRSQTQDNRYPVRNTDNSSTGRNTNNSFPARNTDSRYPVRNTDNSYPVRNTDNSYPVRNTNNSFPARNTDNSYPVQNSDPEIGPRQKKNSCTIL